MTGYRGGLSTDRGEDWRDDAECRDSDPELHFPVSTRPADAEPAKAVCRRCPVVADCLSWALETRQMHGVWGGLDEAERGRILRRKQPHTDERVAAALRDTRSWQAVQALRLSGLPLEVQRLAACGLSDGEIAQRVQRSARQVERIRRSHNIPSGYRLRPPLPVPRRTAAS